MKLELLCTVLLGFAVSTIPAKSQSIDPLPKSIAKDYIHKIDYRVSDEFNDKQLDEKRWVRRNTGGYMVSDHVSDKSLIVMEREGDVGYMSVKGCSDPKTHYKTAGIVSNAASYYGFYVARFRIKGLDTPEVKKDRTIWHPSIWSANMNTGGGQKRKADDGNWLEIDFIEWETNYNGWSCDAPARFTDSKGKKRKVVTTKGPNLEKAIVKEAVKGRDNEQWHTVGLEYSPERLQIWELEDGKWINTSDRKVRFVDEDPSSPERSYTIETIGKSAAAPCFWILGNVVSPYLYKGIEDGSSKQNKVDMSFDIDYFRYYPHTITESLDWKWRDL